MNLTTPETVQKLQKALHTRAKEAPGYRFYTLYDKVYREDILSHAYHCCRANGGAAGVDGQTFADIESYGVAKWLGELADELRNRVYRPQAVRRVYIPKASGSERPLGIPTVSAYCTSYNAASESPGLSFRILEERRTRARSSSSFSALSVIQYGDPALSLRASMSLRSIQ